MPNFVATVQVSYPMDTGLTADVDLNGLKFSYQHGIFYEPSEEFIPVTLPPPFRSGMYAQGSYKAQ